MDKILEIYLPHDATRNEEYRNKRANIGITSEINDLPVIKIEDESNDFITIDNNPFEENTGEMEDLGKVKWLEPQTKLLLSLVEEFLPEVGKSLKLSNKKKMWQLIKIKMNDAGYFFNEIQIENKFRSLERAFKEQKKKRKAGRGKETCPFERELENMLSKKRIIYPECVLDEVEESGSLNNVDRDLDMDFSRPSTSDIERDFETSAKKKNNSFVQQFTKYQESNIQFREKVVQLLEQRNRIREKAEKDKNEYRKQKLELLKKLLNK